MIREKFKYAMELLAFTGILLAFPQKGSTQDTMADRESPLLNTRQPVTIPLPKNEYFRQENAWALVAKGDGNKRYLFPIFKPISVQLFQNGKDVFASVRPNEALDNRLNKETPVKIVAEFVDVLNDASLLSFVRNNCADVPYIKDGEIHRVQLASDMLAKLKAPNRKLGENWQLGSAVKVDRALGKTTLRIEFHVHDREQLMLLKRICRDDLDVEFTSSYLARRTAVALRIHGEIVSSFVNELANQIHTDADKANHVLIPIDGKYASQNQATEQWMHSNAKLYIERRQGIEIDKEVLLEMLSFATNQFQSKLQFQDLKQAERLTFVLSEGIQIDVAVNEIEGINEQTLKDLETRLRQYSKEMSKDDFAAKYQSGAGVGPFQFKFGVGIDKKSARSSTTDHQSLKRSIEQIGKVVSGRLKTISAINLNQMLNWNSRDIEEIGITDGVFSIGEVALCLPISLQSIRNDILVREPPVVNTDLPKFQIGVFLCKSNGRICFVLYSGNDRYELVDEFGRTTVVHPDTDGQFVGWTGISGKFEPDGRITYPGNEWLSCKQSDTNGFAIFFNRGDHNQRCMVRCHPHGLELTDEFGNRTIGVFDPQTRTFSAWGMTAKVDFATGRILWPGNYWQR